MEFIPTYLYIKQHALTGKLYFGKTIKNPIKYLGSGTRWKRHIKQHGKEHVITLWYELFANKEELARFALDFSNEMNIVESTSWLNLIIEDGTSGGGVLGSIKPPRSVIHIQKLLEARAKTRGIKYTKEEKEYLSYCMKLKMPKGKDHWQYGKQHSNETKLKMSLCKIGIPKPTTVCPHCRKVGAIGVMSRWHFDNCKLKNS